MQATPLVSVICICYNHAPYVQSAIRSVLQQTYRTIELLVVDDASTDESRQMIEQILAPYPSVWRHYHSENKGLCRSFNEALAHARGEWVIDLAADDVLMPNRIERQVQLALRSTLSVGVLHHLALRIHPNGTPLGIWKGHNQWYGVEGEVLPAVLQATCIATPTMMMRKSLLDALHGYNESLSAEDFDFWVRSSQLCKYAFQEEVLTLWRDVPGSLSKRRTTEMLEGVWRVVHQVAPMLSTKSERDALAIGATYYERQALVQGNLSLAQSFGHFSRRNVRTRLLYLCFRMGIPLAPLYRMYVWLIR